jgi:ABC-type dipeptide/oligopeptide/nickel transport system permease component
MINNPLPQQVMQDKDNTYLANQYYEHCSDTGKEVAKKYNLKSELYDDFIEYFTDLCTESDDGYSLINDKSLIDEWWEENSDMYEDPSPYEDYEPTDDEMMSSFGTKWHDGL